MFRKISRFFFRDENFSQKFCFRKILKNFGKSQNSIGISMIPFITRYKGNHRNPYRILGFSKIFQNFSKTKFLRKIFISKKKSRNFSEHLCQLKICPGFQKSHLEQRAVRLKSRKTPYPVFFSRKTGSRYSVTYTDP